MLKSFCLLLLLAINQVHSSGRAITSSKESDYFQLDVDTFSRSKTDPKNIIIATSLGGSSVSNNQKVQQVLIHFSTPNGFSK
jgi:hypothetical protein